ncbi:MAG: YgfZ/GcvT domain-containing protein [Acidimicrobiales bacterium]
MAGLAATMDPLQQYRLVKGGAAAVHLRRDVVRAEGPDAGAYLQGQLSQDVAALSQGESAWSLVLAPAGRVDALVRVTRLDDGWIVDTDGGWGEALVARLGRFKLRTKVDFALLDWKAVGLRGPAVVAPAPDEGAPVVVDASWPGLAGLDLLGPAPAVPAGMAEVDGATYEALRIEAGVPVNGAELTERTIPAEAGIVGRTVSFTKGCYTGQELVARIDSRGSNVARHLRGVLLDGPVPAGATLESAGKQVGWVTSAARSPALGWVGLAYLARSVVPPCEVGVSGGGVARVRALPLDGGEA